MKKLIMILVLVLSSVVTNAQISVRTNSYWFRDEFGVVASHGSVMIVCDTSGNGFSAQSGSSLFGAIAQGAYLGNSDDVILGWGSVNAAGQSIFSGQVAAGTNGVVAGKNVGLVWFSRVSTSDTCLLGSEAYGFYRPTNAANWIVYGEGMVGEYSANSIFGGSSMHNAVPEPASYALAVGSIILCVAFVRKHINRKV